MNLYFVFVCFHLYGFVLCEDLYDILGVRRSATKREIKQAYKKLAMQYHPDKNNDQGANDKFIRINEAYETLSDSEKRSEYDQFGTTSKQQGQRPHHGGFDDFNPFESFFGGGGFRFQFNRGRPRDSHRTTIREYMQSILPQTKEKPFIIYAYADFCIECMRMQNVWDKVVSDANKIGMGVATVNVQVDRTLAHRLRVSYVPSIVAVVDGRVRYLSGAISLQRVREFIKNSVPSDLIQWITNENYHEFVSNWHDNRVRMLLFADRGEPTLRFTMAAYAARHRVAAGYVHTRSENTDEVLQRFSISKYQETLQMFNEFIDQPIVTLSMHMISRETFDQTIESNKFLVLPRLSSHTIYNELCPYGTATRKKAICVVLLASRTMEFQSYLTSFRNMARDQSHDERVRYTYVYKEAQIQFVEAITNRHGIENATTHNPKVAVVWRPKDRQVSFDWFEGGWPSDAKDVPQASAALSAMVASMLTSSSAPPYRVNLYNELVDEFQTALWVRMMLKLLTWFDSVYEYIMSVDEMTWVTGFLTVTMMLAVCYIMKVLVDAENDRIHEGRPTQRSPGHSQHQHDQVTVQSGRPVVNLRELLPETISPLVRHTQRGVRTVIILINEEMKAKILQQFATIILPYTRCAAFHFAFLDVDKRLAWYRHLLEQTIGFRRDISGIKPGNCIGTVIALNGVRKYYCLYHPLAEIHKQERNTGEFLGFDDSESDSEQPVLEDLEQDAQKLFTDDVLQGLPAWMDKLCEGSLQRCRVEYWPDLTS